MELNASDKIRRFCYLGRLDPVYGHLRGTINVSFYRPQLEVLCKSLDHNTMLIILKQVLQETTLVRRDEPLFVYAVYLASDVDIVEKTALRKVFPALIQNDEDLFLFCKYAIIIQRERNHKGFTNTVRKAINSWYESQTPDNLHQMWLSHRGGHGFTHQSLLKLCHVNDDTIGAAGVVTPFFKTCTELLKMSEGSENAVDKEEKSKSSTETTTSAILSVSKLRTTNNKTEALKIIRKFKLRYNQVPIHFLRSGPIMEALIPTMTLKQLLLSWRYLARYNHFENPKVMKLCRSVFENKKLLRKDNIHPIVLLMHMRDLGICDEKSKLTPKRAEALKISLLKPLYQQSFGNNESTGLRMHITINIQKNYKKKTLKNHKKLAYLEAAVALAFGYFKREKEVNVFYWANDKHKLGHLPWNHEYISIDEAFKLCDALEITGTPQRLITPIMRAMDAKQVYDVFLVIVPNAGRGNPKNSSELLTKFLDKYRQTRNEKAKYVIVDLLKFRKSMRYSDTRNENILEICGLDDHTTNLINNFALNRFG
ncbi:60 kDa SS-A/Ro ribonucleoprotein [Ceratitis capitata]|uniref:60 kDa SS-A/Ro ribonucleoprotein n=1 Tax=Ceratitis capitata TaxID=7213 RepID=W8B069_CERCA|nr:60 kDa SS-A/Ro ribonucleoprotein [Ceratitis capitata]XP_020717792.1 60 kDa SS-A/Ro ribonucleoprotein [Ceratitis capitata]